MTPDKSSSIRARLLAKAKNRGEEFTFILDRYATECFLHRLSISNLRDRYYLKGALLFELWFQRVHRPTRDADLLGFDLHDANTMESTFKEICSTIVDDGITFDLGSLKIEEIREGDRYGGFRARFIGRLNDSLCHVQVDVGFGDVVKPGPVEVEFPRFFEDDPKILLKAYPRSTTFAEKFEAIVSLGMANSRIKDYYDLYELIKEGVLRSDDLIEALTATFTRRKTSLPEGVPVGLSADFASNPSKQALWNGFLTKNRLEAPALNEVVDMIRSYIETPLSIVRQRMDD